MQNKTPIISGFDLNLIGIFEEIYKFGSVTKAAKSLKLSPSSVSQSLQKLRVHFSDPLFVRNGMRLTTTTDAIHHQISIKYNTLLDGLNSLATAASKDLLIIHCSTYLSIRILPYIASWVTTFAPGCKIIHRDFMRDQDTSEELLLLRGVDIVFDVLPAYNFSLKTHVLFSEDITFVCRREHPRLGTHLSMEEAKLERFSLFDSNGLDIQLGQVNINSQLGDRVFGFTSGSMLTIGSVIACTDIIGVIPVWLYEKYSYLYDIRRLDCDIELKPSPVYMMYSKTSLQNATFQHLIDCLESKFISHQETFEVEHYGDKREHAI